MIILFNLGPLIQWQSKNRRYLLYEYDKKDKYKNKSTNQYIIEVLEKLPK